MVLRAALHIALFACRSWLVSFRFLSAHCEFLLVISDTKPPRNKCGLSKSCPSGHFAFKITSGAASVVGPRMCLEDRLWVTWRLKIHTKITRAARACVNPSRPGSIFRVNAKYTTHWVLPISSVDEQHGVTCFIKHKEEMADVKRYMMEFLKLRTWPDVEQQEVVFFSASSNMNACTFFSCAYMHTYVRIRINRSTMIIIVIYFFPFEALSSEVSHLKSGSVASTWLQWPDCPPLFVLDWWAAWRTMLREGSTSPWSTVTFSDQCDSTLFLVLADFHTISLHCSAPYR